MDWKSVITELQAVHGLTQPQIAAECGCGQVTISDLARGATKDPRHSLGQALCVLLDRYRAAAAKQAADQASAQQLLLELADRRTQQVPIDFPDRRAAVQGAT